MICSDEKGIGLIEVGLALILSAFIVILGTNEIYFCKNYSGAEFYNEKNIMLEHAIKKLIVNDTDFIKSLPIDKAAELKIDFLKKNEYIDKDFDFVSPWGGRARVLIKRSSDGYVRVLIGSYGDSDIDLETRSTILKVVGDAGGYKHENIIKGNNLNWSEKIDDWKNSDGVFLGDSTLFYRVVVKKVLIPEIKSIHYVEKSLGDVVAQHEIKNNQVISWKPFFKEDMIKLTWENDSIKFVKVKVGTNSGQECIVTTSENYFYVSTQLCGGDVNGVSLIPVGYYDDGDEFNIKIMFDKPKMAEYVKALYDDFYAHAYVKPLTIAHSTTGWQPARSCKSTKDAQSVLISNFITKRKIIYTVNSQELLYPLDVSISVYPFRVERPWSPTVFSKKIIRYDDLNIRESFEPESVMEHLKLGFDVTYGHGCADWEPMFDLVLKVYSEPLGYGVFRASYSSSNKGDFFIGLKHWS